MKKRLLNACLICLLLTSCNNTASSNNSNKEVKIEVKNKKDSKVYMNLENYINLPTTFFTFDEDVPYVNIEDYINNFLMKINGEIQHYSIKNNVVTNIDTNISLTFDTTNNTIYTDDLDQFTNTTDMKINSKDILDVNQNPRCRYSSSNSSYTKGNKITINLNEYNTRIIKYENRIYVPFSYLDNIFCFDRSSRFTFNGDNFYVSNVDSMLENDVLDEYGTTYYSGSLANIKQRSDSYINYFYYSFLFEMIYNDGKSAGISVIDLDNKLETLGLKSELKSKDSKVADLAIAKTLYTAFSDGGHTRFSNLGVTTPYNKENNEYAAKLIYSLDPRNKKLVDTFTSLKEKRGNLTDNLSINGETAIIRFDIFDESESTSTFILFKDSFETIKENSSIKNVVFDVTLNGGGASMALCNALSFLTDDPIKIKIKNPTTGSINVEAVEVDNNQDGNFDDKDSYQGKYNFYVLTSNFSFSSANAFAVYCKDYNLAKIIGKRSGGGDCAIASGVSVDGSFWNMSSTSMLIRKDNTSYDDGASLDYELDDSYFYDDSKLNSFLSSLK